MVEEQGLFRSGLRTVLEGAGYAVSREYGTASAALDDEEGLGELEPDTVVLCSMTVEGWEAMVHRLLLQTPELRVVGVVDEVGERSAIEALSHGLVA